MSDGGSSLAGEFAFDSDRQYLGEVYAKALLGAAGPDQAAEVVDQLESLVHDVLKKQPLLKAVLEAPRIPFAAKESLLDKAFGPGANQMLPVFMTFLKVCARRGRLDCLRQIAISARKQLDTAQGRMRIQVKTATPIEGDLQGAILSRLEAALGVALDVQNVVDPALLGGLVVRVGDTVYDGSVAHRLERMRGDAVAKAVEAFRTSMGSFAEDTD